MTIEDNNTPKELSIHECCHAVVVRIFKEYIKLDQITATRNELLEEGMLAANTVRGIYDDKSKSDTAMGIALLAGVVGDTISKEGASAVKERKNTYANEPKQLHWKLGGGDEPLLENNVTYVARQYQCDPVKYLGFCVHLAIDFLSDPAVWGYVEKLSAKLLSKENLLMEENELNAFFQKSEFDTYMQSKKEVLMQTIANVEVECAITDPYLNPGPDCPLF